MIAIVRVIAAVICSPAIAAGQDQIKETISQPVGAASGVAGAASLPDVVPVLPPLPAWTPSTPLPERSDKRDAPAVTKPILTVVSHQANANEQISPADLEQFVTAIQADDLGRAKVILDEMQLAQSDEHAAYYELRAMYEARAGRPDKARALLQRALELAPGDVTILRNLKRLGVDAATPDADVQADEFGR